MSHALVTITAPLALSRLAAAEAAIEALGNPCTDAIREALDTDADQGTHFASFHAFASTAPGKAWLLFEFSADGREEDALARIANAIGDQLRPVFQLAEDWTDGGDLRAWMLDHQLAIGGGWFDNPGVAFAGTPGMSVGRIRDEAKLAKNCGAILATLSGDLSPLAQLNVVRAKVGAPAMLDPADAAPPWQPADAGSLIAKLAVPFITTYLWPLVALVVLGALGCGLWNALNPPHHMGWLSAFLCYGWKALWRGALIALAIVLVGALAIYLSLRSAEATDATDDRAPDPATNAAIFARENHFRHNHMISITGRKPGFVRGFTLRLVFWALSKVVGVISPPGFLGSIGTIHFARWVTPPGSRDLIFLSNYGGSWESYLEDFITRAHDGLTGVWSNTVGFPRANNLVQDGATDAERFKRYARRSMIPTRFWYSAYPDLTTKAIRTNAEIRRGFSGAMTEAEASGWLSLFGSAARPASKLISSEIQSLIFGGLGFLNHGTALVFDRLPADRAKARQWLNAIRGDIAFNDGRRLKKDRAAVLTLGLGAGALIRLGLTAGEVGDFPFAFVAGMGGAGRAQILGDDPEKLTWGRQSPDVILLVYGETPSGVRDLQRTVMAHAKTAGIAEPYEIPLETVSEGKAEPFGFADGISQPVIRGTYKGMRNADPIHLVEPGEFILGYPDNRGNRPPGPTLSAWRDPQSRLPLVDQVPGFDRNQAEHPRDLCANGSFLVVRELEQDVDAFWAYCGAEATRVKAQGRLPEPYDVTPQFIGAKMIGRWPDGSSLARNPYHARSDKGAEAASSNATLRAVTSPAGGTPVPAAPPQGASAKLGDNDFLFGAEDPEALRCPFGAHIRRANPRDSLNPGTAEEIDITNRHRIIRVGRPYAKRRGIKPGILFMCLNGDIERQFEFVQQTWLRNPAFHGLTSEQDLIVVDGSGTNCGFTIPSRDGPVALNPMPRFVNTRGGGYFFLPAKRLIDFLCHLP